MEVGGDCETDWNWILWMPFYALQKQKTLLAKHKDHFCPDNLKVCNPAERGWVYNTQQTPLFTFLSAEIHNKWYDWCLLRAGGNVFVRKH